MAFLSEIVDVIVDGILVTVFSLLLVALAGLDKFDESLPVLGIG